MNGAGYTIKMTIEGKYRAIDNSDDSFAEFDTLGDAMDFSANVFQIPEEELEFGMIQMVKNNHYKMEFGAFRGAFIYSE